MGKHCTLPGESGETLPSAGQSLMQGQRSEVRNSAREKQTKGFSSTESWVLLKIKTPLNHRVPILYLLNNTVYNSLKNSTFSTS